MKICSIEGCGKGGPITRGYCSAHYRRWLIYGDALAPRRRPPPRPKRGPEPCQHEGCERVGRVTKGLCDKHYMRKLRHGRTDAKRGWENKARLHSKHPMYGGWVQMLLRCHYPKVAAYRNYGALGISVCQRWRDDFQSFLADMGERPEGMTLDRIDPHGDYEPGNCRWADHKTQRANRSRAGDQANRLAMSRGVKARWVKWRLERGLPPETPSRQEYKRRRKEAGLPY